LDPAYVGRISLPEMKIIFRILNQVSEKINGKKEINNSECRGMIKTSSKNYPGMQFGD
jgi:hypothetical protein